MIGDAAVRWRHLLKFETVSKLSLSCLTNAAVSVSHTVYGNMKEHSHRFNWYNGDLNNKATRADLRGITKHWEMTAKAGRQSTIYTSDFDAIFFITRYRIIQYPYSGFLWARCSPFSDIEQRVRPSALGLHLTGDFSSLDRRCHTSIDKKFAIKSLYFSSQSTVSSIIFDSTSYVYVLDKRNTLWLRDTVRQTSHIQKRAHAECGRARPQNTFSGLIRMFLYFESEKHFVTVEIFKNDDTDTEI